MALQYLFSHSNRHSFFRDRRSKVKPEQSANFCINFVSKLCVTPNGSESKAWTRIEEEEEVRHATPLRNFSKSLES